ncbi:MAG: hypothetical protein B6244_08810 [Candidatus Cloacimonetes bacterium 4572_55]|nr:MAG: hypothetical protein B6244_08810 [Candidatus Cloacimonetes bacterium 4572_55]
MARRAVELGIWLGISDHLDTEMYLKNDREVAGYYDRIRSLSVYTGIEVSIEPRLHVSTDLLDRFDYTIAALHQVDGQSLFHPDFVCRNIDTIIGRMIDHVDRFLGLYSFDILAHPTLIPRAWWIRPETVWSEKRLEQLVDVGIAHGVAFEINARSMTPLPKFVEIAVSKNARFSVGSDSHRIQSLGKLSYPHRLIDAYQIPEEWFFFPKSKI